MRQFCRVIFTCLLSFSVFAEAPVVDERENFAMLDEQQAAYQPPVAHESDDSAYADDQHALAKETIDNTDDQQTNVGVVNKLQRLQQDIQELRGQLETQTHDLKLLQEQQLAFYKDLDARLQAAPAGIVKKTPVMDHPANNASAASLSTTPSVATSQASTVSPPIQPVITAAHANPADEQISYLAAYEFVKNKQFDDALTAMHAFVVKYPNGGYTANAQYWLGELYMVKKNYQQAIEHFEIVLQQFPSSGKCSASLLKIGYALAADGKKVDARARLQEVMKKYPDTNTAQLASAKLATLES